MHVTLSKNGTMISLDMNVKNQRIGVLAKKSYMWNPITCDCRSDKTCEIGEYLDF